VPAFRKKPVTSCPTPRKPRNEQGVQVAQASACVLLIFARLGEFKRKQAEQAAEKVDFSQPD
jgi:hypothetical protein